MNRNKIKSALNHDAASLAKIEAIMEKRRAKKTRSQRAVSLALIIVTINLLVRQISPTTVAENSSASSQQPDKYAPVFIVGSNGELVLTPARLQQADRQAGNNNSPDLARDGLLNSELESIKLSNTNGRLRTESGDGEVLAQFQQKPQAIINPSVSQLEKQLTEIISSALDAERRQQLELKSHKRIGPLQPLTTGARMMLSSSTDNDNRQLGSTDNSAEDRHWLDGAITKKGAALEAGGDGGDGDGGIMGGLKPKTNERKRRMSASPNLQRNLLSPDQQINAMQSLSSLLDLDYARVYKPKIISTARGFGR